MPMVRSIDPSRHRLARRTRPGGSFHMELAGDVPAVRRVTTPLARRFHQICTTMVADSLAGADLTPLQFGVLAHLNNQDGDPGIDQNTLAARLGIERSHASLLVEELGSRGLLDRLVNGSDRRARILQLTSKGEKLYRRLLPANFAANERILEPLTPRERGLLHELLVRVIQHNGAHARPGAGRRKRAPSPRSEPTHG